MIINGEREKGKEPSLWKEITIEFHLYGDIDKDKALKAAELSLDKYCSVAATLINAGADVKWKMFVHPAD
jgi:putative redox protein